MSTQQDDQLRPVTSKIPDELHQRFKERCATLRTTVLFRIRELIEMDVEVGIEQLRSGPLSRDELRGELAAMAALFLSARYRVNSTDAAIEAVIRAFLSGEIHREIEQVQYREKPQ